MAAPSSRNLTYEEFLAFPDEDELRLEYVDGEVYELPSAITRHQRVERRLVVAFGNFLEENGGGEAFLQLDVELRYGRRVCPDLVFVSDARVETVGDKCIVGTPSLIIEILSSDARRDRVFKRNLYAEHGLPEYWVADTDADRFEVDRLADGRYERPQIVMAGETLTPLELPGLVIDVASIFRR